MSGFHTHTHAADVRAGRVLRGESSETCPLLRAQVGDLGTLATTPASAATAGASEEGCEVEAKVAAAAEVVDEVGMF